MIHAQARQLLIAFTVASGLAWRGLQKRSLTSAGHVRMRADGVCAPVFSVGFVCSGPASDALARVVTNRCRSRFFGRSSLLCILNTEWRASHCLLPVR
jgi:hypothetical protein